MRPLKMFLAAAFALLLSGCATNVTPQPTGGSRADGTVVVSYQYGIFEQPVIDWSQAEASAKKRCKAWGYKKAEAFEGSNNVCQAFNGYGNCVRMQVNITYQCTK